MKDDCGNCACSSRLIRLCDGCPQRFELEPEREAMTKRDVWAVWAMAFGSFGIVALIGCVATFWSELRGLL
jgi:hypothetical protein